MFIDWWSDFSESENDPAGVITGHYSEVGVVLVAGYVHHLANYSFG